MPYDCLLFLNESEWGREGKIEGESKWEGMRELWESARVWEHDRECERVNEGEQECDSVLEKGRDSM